MNEHRVLGSSFDEEDLNAKDAHFESARYILFIKSLKLTVTVGMVVVGAVFPAAAVGIVVAGLVRIAVEAAMNAAEEQCGKF